MDEKLLTWLEILVENIPHFERVLQDKMEITSKGFDPGAGTLMANLKGAEKALKEDRSKRLAVKTTTLKLQGLEIEFKEGDSLCPTQLKLSW